MLAADKRASEGGSVNKQQGFLAGGIAYVLASSALFFLLPGAAAHAQGFPIKPIRIVIGFAPGGSNDIVARHLAPKLAEIMAVQVIVENRPGANAMIGTEFVARSAPDGYTLALGSISPLVLSPQIYTKTSYDTLNDFVGLTTVGMTPQVIVVNRALPARSLKEFIALAKSHPGKLNLASSGTGSNTHVAIELLKITAGIDVQHVAYKGTAPALLDVIGGQIEGAIGDLPGVFPHVKAEKLRGLVVTSERRSPLLPDVPTAAEQGLPALLAVNWFAVMAPAKTPAAIVDKLHAALVKAATSPETKERFLSVGVESMTSPSPGAFSTYLRSEYARWGKVIRESGIRAD
jgi:tripartite-type tricarboxylate transporter receptor subunit TctC